MTRRELFNLLASTGLGSLIGCRKLAPVPSAGPRALVGHLRTNWSQDPYAFGAYSYVSNKSPGTGESDKAVVREPIDGRIFFAGEALNPNYASSVHAAHDSGVAVAKSVADTNPTHVAIIGAGMSGLSAAHTLASKGVRVTVIEARDRLGGRIWTDRSLGTAVDLGATWIHGPEGNPLTRLADEAGMERVVTDDAYVVRGADGRRISDLMLPGWLNAFGEQTSTGAEASEMNGKYLTSVFMKYGLGYDGPDVKFPNGYDAIFTSLEGDYDVVLSSPVERITLHDDGVAVGVTGKAPRRFDAVLVTASLGVLKKGLITFEPALSAEKTAAIARMGMGVLDKLYLRFDRVFWDREATNILTPDNGLPRGQFNFWVNFYPYIGVPILMVFNAANAARSLADKSDEEMIAMALNTLRGAYPE